ncbi:cytochrome P450 [Streptomyces prunicolor]|uniref:cytochrome P450 n=1 Tax=Streptomyces prunicolor TaxID=67348 RepID=UPI00386AF7D1|nr:cytochrome P450 [Streptomyces prunicolor]
MTHRTTDPATDTDTGTGTATATAILEGLLTEEGSADPFPLFERARALGPVLPTGDGVLLVTGYEEAERLTRDRAFGIRRTEAGEATGPGGTEHLAQRIISASLLETDPPRHTRLRSLVSSFFAARRIPALEPLIAAAVEDLLDEMAGQAGHAGTPGSGTLGSGTLDFMEVFASRLPMSVICELMGVPKEDRHRFRALSSALTVTLEIAQPPEAVLAADAAAAELVDYFSDLTARRRADPQDDLVSALATAAEGAAGGDARLSEDEMLSMFVLLLVSGFETTASLLGNALALSFQHPLAAAGLRDGTTPLLGFVDEVLRLDAPIQYAARVPLTEGLDAGGVPAPLGTVALVLLGAANRDPRQFDRPAEFDSLRTGPQPLAFGGGAHFCLGAPLARLEASIALPALLRRFPRLRPAGEPVRRYGLMLRGYEELPVTLG